MVNKEKTKAFFKGRKKGSKSDLINMKKYNKAKEKAAKKNTSAKKYPVLSPREDLDRKNARKKPKCWTGYKQVGFKKKGGRKVPNCVKK